MKQAYIYPRWSSKIQGEGHSRERQTEICQEWYDREIKRLGMPLANLQCDDGFSAYRGKHVEKGSLGHFLAEIKAGKIDKGSILIVENADRISRQGPKLARKIIEREVDEGVEMHTSTSRKSSLMLGRTSKKSPSSLTSN